MAFDEKIQRPKSLTDLAVERIRSTIIEGRFALGEQLSEVTLATTLGISKTPVREALFQLKLEGLVDVHPQRGTFVFDLTEEEVIDICAFRELIETAALTRAMATSKEKLLSELESVIEATKQAAQNKNHKEIAVLDRQFHGAILSCANSVNLSAAYKLIAYKIQALRARLPDEDDDIAHCNDNHRILVDEIRNGTSARAQKLLREHIRNTQEAYLSASANKLALTV